ncbi:MAG: cupin domain-containing protein [Myxococcales bacterium]|nr:cupin domain-containing protein [Myxococcales bacterium]
MAGLRIKNVRSPDETRPFTDKGRAELLKLGDVTVGRAVFEPGWRWSKHVKPIAQTDQCESAHVGYCLSGKMRVRMKDGEEAEFGPGDVVTIAPGHDAWVVGEEECVFLDFAGLEHYAQRAATEEAPAVH